MKGKSRKVKRSPALFLAFALIFTTLPGDVSIVHAEDGVSAEINGPSDEGTSDADLTREVLDPTDGGIRTASYAVPGTTSGKFTVKKSFTGIDTGVAIPQVILTYEAFRTRDGEIVGAKETGIVNLARQSDGIYTGVITPTVWNIRANGTGALPDTERARYKNVVVIAEDPDSARLDGYTLKSFEPVYFADGTIQSDKKVNFTINGATFEKNLSVKNIYTKDEAAAPDMSITKTADRSFGEIGSNVNYTINVSNSGKADAVNVTVTDILNTEMLKFEKAEYGGTESNGTVTWDMNIPAGEKVELKLTAQLIQIGMVENKATVTLDNVSKDSNTVTVTVSEYNRKYGLYYHSNTTDPVENMPPDYEITSTAMSHETKVSSQIPIREGYTFSHWTIDQEGKRYDSGEDFKFEAAELNTSSVTYDLYAHWVPDKHHKPTAIDDLSIAKTSSMAAPRVGEEFDYIIKVVNSSMEDMVVTIADVLPDALTFVSASDGGTNRVSAGNSGGTVIWQDITVPSRKGNEDSSKTVTVTVKANTVMNGIRNTATVTFDGDGKTSNEVIVDSIDNDTDDRIITIKYVDKNGNPVHGKPDETKNRKENGQPYRDNDLYDPADWVNAGDTFDTQDPCHHYIVEKVEDPNGGIVNGDVTIIVTVTLNDPTDPAVPGVDPNPTPTPTSTPAPTPAPIPTVPVAAVPTTFAAVTSVPKAAENENEHVPLANESKAETNSEKLTELENEEVPLVATKNRSWALINFALMNLAIYESLMLLIGYFIQTKKTSEEDDRETEKKLKKKGIIRMISLPIALISLIAFCLTEDITLSTGFVDRYTIVMTIIAIAQTIVVTLSRKKEEEKK